ncbi:MAG: YkgJ family cysteine cluster protein [Syntrophobacteraceae bacterium]
MENRKLFDSNGLKKSLRRNRKPGNSTLRILCHPGFPLYYMLRNLGWLEGETWWASLSLRAKRVQALRMLGQRAALFSQVKNWRKGLKDVQIPEPEDNVNVPDYCNKCGLCCEVASGKPDFPAPRDLPEGWGEFFGNGLGKGHRFCPFLWEDNSDCGGLCSIYHLRSNPCRLFGPEECEFFWKSTEPERLSNAIKSLKLARWLSTQRRLAPRPGG